MDSNAKRAVIFVIICILALCVNHWICNKFKKQYVRVHEMTVIDNKEYETKEIDYITRELSSDENAMIIIEKDGDKIYVRTCVLKDKGEK